MGHAFPFDLPGIIDDIHEARINKDYYAMDANRRRLEDARRANLVGKDEDIESLIQSSGIFDRLQVSNSYNRFSRFNILDPYNAMTTTKEYIFITKPDLNLLKSNGQINDKIKNNDYLLDAYERFPDIFRQMQYSISKSDGPFIPLLTNTITTGLDLPGLNSDMVDTATNIYGTTMSYRGDSYSSDESFDFTLEFEDSKYLEVYNLFKIYDEYERMKKIGQIDPPTFMYIYRKILHDQVSVYKIVVAEDGSTIIYWARAVGVTFNSIPRDAFSDMNNSDGQKISIGCRAWTVRDLNKRILSDFNKITADSMFSGDNSKFGKLKNVPLFNKTLHAPDARWPNVPWISEINSVRKSSRKGSMGRYQLNWGLT